MAKTDRRAARTAWKERKADWAICAVRIGEETWLKCVPDPAALERRMDFSMRTQGGALPAMHAAYRAAGEMTVEVIERLDADLSDMARETYVKDRLTELEKTMNAKAF